MEIRTLMLQWIARRSKRVSTSSRLKDITMTVQGKRLLLNIPSKSTSLSTKDLPMLSRRSPCRCRARRASKLTSSTLTYLCPTLSQDCASKTAQMYPVSSRLPNKITRKCWSLLMLLTLWKKYSTHYYCSLIMHMETTREPLWTILFRSMSLIFAR